MDSKRGPGRPVKRDYERRRKALNMRVTDALYEAIERVAIEAGLSMTEEATRRLERTFRADEQGERALMTMLADNLLHDRYSVMSQLLRAVRSVEDSAGKTFLESQDVREQIIAAFVALIYSAAGVEYGAGKWRPPSPDNMGKGYGAALAEMERDAGLQKIEIEVIEASARAMWGEVENKREVNFMEILQSMEPSVRKQARKGMKGKD